MRSMVFMLTLAMLGGGIPVLARKPGYVVWVDRVTVRGKTGDPF